jgi:hypothetical protein
MKKTTVLAIAATLAMGFTGAAWAQETVGANGEQVDGFGSAGNAANQTNPDGPNEGSWWLLGHSARTNDVNCDVKIRNSDCFKGSIRGDYQPR